MCRWTAGDFSPLCRHQTPTVRPIKLNRIHLLDTVLLKLPSLHLVTANAGARLGTTSASGGTDVIPGSEIACERTPHSGMVHNCIGQKEPKTKVAFATLVMDFSRRYPSMQNSLLYTFYREGSERYMLLLEMPA